MNKFCKFYSGLSLPCGMGVDFKTIKGPGKFEYPCFNTDIHTCSFAIYPTPEEEQIEEKALNELLEKVTRVRKLIIEQSKGKRNVTGRLKCSECEKGYVNYSIAYNGHVHARCTTDHCVDWVE